MKQEEWKQKRSLAVIKGYVKTKICTELLSCDLLQQPEYRYLARKEFGQSYR